MAVQTQIPLIINKAAPGMPYFSPAHPYPAGTALDPQPDGKPIPKLFQPIKIRGVEFQNRIFMTYYTPLVPPPRSHQLQLFI
ncbi:hypothetical protein EWM64_g7734 [Hericium alpestre]|uniref:Uncharacterized protein n=1 Tax=Hericium alpestre TaxID=135208 RepID=A0A4Y9ZRZ9_9AGAM|nr:hypothetical protein EWM64_g7734 [Hericium alpestre]